ncbi:hypothetical protein [Mesorhizobium sp.]|uniref:hypothetical protein n=1 Tax=Mesorhizobium sp. TaxID=1871066 RepID=UPI0025FE8CAD|nr:hypothetical protein [Mesorhizobium sp.]
MKSTTIKRIAASMLAGMLVLSSFTIALAGSLAGSVGDKRFPPTLSLDPKQPCTKAYNAYVAANGHSAYATTFYSRVVDLYIICGSKLNAPSQKAAEDVAMQSCMAGLKRLKVRTASGGCAIAASK